MTPIVRGVPAIACVDKNCVLCRGLMKEVYSEWICPHCNSHLSRKYEICLNLCGLSESSQKRFISLFKQKNDK